ncbi:MAG: hypothetical protein AAGU76_11665 [Sedimentibacter sp.]|uniref:hypothetical protein n=1 Tax=Sedimentibacter sp. TaxID=1960295 RepID=UPI003159449C
MSKNSKLLYSILGCFILALLNNPIFESSRLGIFEYARDLAFVVIYQIFNILINVLSFTGFVLLIVFSVRLIISNVGKDK